MSKGVFSGSMAKALGFVGLAAVVVLSITGFVLYEFPTIFKGASTTPQQCTNGATNFPACNNNSGTLSLNLPMTFSVLDLFTGGGLATTSSGYTTGGAVLVSVINPSTGLTQDSATVTSGSVTSGNTGLTNYASNGNWFITICRQGTSSSPACTTNPETNTTSFFGTAITVPYAQANTQTTYGLTVYAKSVGTYTISVLTDAAASVTAGSTTSYTGSVTKSWTIIAADTVDNTGFANYLNTATGHELDLGFKISETGANSTILAIDNWQANSISTSATTIYYWNVPTTGFLDRQKLPNGQLNPSASGTFSTTITLDTAPTALSTVYVMKVQLVGFWSSTYFKANNAANNPEALAMSTFTFNVKRGAT